MSGDIKIYSVSLDMRSVDVRIFLQYITDSKDIYGYWNYLPWTFFVKTNITAYDLTQKISNILPGSLFIVSEVNKWNVNGLLPQAAWDWFHDRPSSLGKLFDSTPSRGE